MLKENLNPTAKIAVSKNILKHYKFSNEDVVYLSDGTDFQIELFNPTKEIILAKIEINGKPDNEGLVLYPAQRVFLERSLSDNHKFRFITYNIEDNQENKECIKDNGLIVIKFYKEQLPISNYILTTSNYLNNPIMSPQIYYGTCQDAIPSVFTCQANINLETGIITKGEKSNQQFSDTYEQFSNYSFHSVNIKIFPQSKQPVSVYDIKHKKYCSECGSKLREKDKFVVIVELKYK